MGLGGDWFEVVSEIVQPRFARPNSASFTSNASMDALSSRMALDFNKLLGFHDGRDQIRRD